MATLQERLAQQIPGIREEIKKLAAEHGEKVVSQVTVSQLFGGLRGVKSLVCDTSLVDPDKGLSIRGRMINELADKLPEEIFYLLLTGELPDKDGLAALQKDLKKRSRVPDYVWKVLKSMPADSHPMAMLNTAILVMEKESKFKKAYDKGMKKDEYWIPMMEDVLTLLARLPAVAAGVYRIRYKKGKLLKSNSKLDWGADYAQLLGIKDPTGQFANLMRLYLTLHCDHESGNVSAHSSHVVGSALSDVYYSVSAGLNGLAGPLHGLANQECLKFVLEIKNKYKGIPTDEELKKMVWDTLNSGKVIPGYGHAVLRVTDPRFTAFRDFGLRVCPEAPVFKIVDRLFAVVPEILKQHGKAKNIYPNVDAGSGALLYYFGLKEFDYYTVLFGVSRVLGIGSQLILSRATGSPIDRPKSVQTSWVKQAVGAM